MESSRKPTKLGEFVRNQRKRLGLTQLDVAQRLTERGFAYSEPAVANWEAGRGVMPLAGSKNGVNFLDVLAESLEVSPLQVLAAAGYLSRTDLKFDPDTYEIAQMLERVTPTQRTAVKQLLASMLTGAA